MAKTVCKLLGVVFVLVGICGFLMPHLLGAHLTPPHNLVHLVSGAIALYFGFAGSGSAARGFCIIFGLVYLLLGVVGWFMGAGPDHMFNVGSLLMLGKMDHIIHILLGIIFLIGGALSFDGTDDSVAIPDASSVDLTTGMTVEAWVQTTLLTNWRTS